VSAGSPSLWAMFVRQFLVENKLFWRSPIQAFFSLIFPLLMLLVFATLFGNERMGPRGPTPAQFYAPSLAVYGAVSTAYWNLAISVVTDRELGILKRARGTPLPPWLFLSGRLASSAWVAFLAIALMIGVGVWGYGIEVQAERLAAALLTFVTGVACFAALGLLVASFSPNADATPAITSPTCSRSSISPAPSPAPSIRR